MRLFSPVRVITLGNKLKERFAPRRFTLLFHQINDEGKWVFLNGPTHTLCYCHVCPPLCGSFGLGFSICVSAGAPSTFHLHNSIIGLAPKAQPINNLAVASRSSFSKALIRRLRRGMWYSRWR